MTLFDHLPLVSVIISTYNRCHLLQQSLGSVLCQTYPKLEIIVVDDGSSDDTVAMLAQYAGRVKIVQQANRGAAAARNRGMSVSQGEYLTFLDDDDLLKPTKIARQVQALRHQPQKELIHTGYYYGDGMGQALQKVWLLPSGDIRQQLVAGNFIWSGAPLVRRSCLEQTGGFDERLTNCEDWDLWVRLALTGCQFGVVQTPLGTYRLQPNSKVTNLARLEQSVMTVLAKIFARVDLPEQVAAAKSKAYAQMHLWLSAQGFAGGKVDTGQHHLVQALHEQPVWRDQPETLLPRLRSHSLDARVTDPPRFITDLFAHLPDMAEFLRPHYPWLLTYAHLGLALRHQANGDVSEAQKGFAAARQIYPALTHQPDKLAPFLTEYALSLPVDEPVRFAAAVLSQLPLTPQTTQHVLGDVSLGWAFQAYFDGDVRVVPRRVLAAWRHRPALLKNRGSWAIFLKSFRRQGNGNDV